MGFFVTVEDLQFRQNLKKYKEMMGKELGAVVREQSKLLAKRLMQLTPPYSKSQGNTAVERDIKRVYLRGDDWFIDTFMFMNQKLGERVQELVKKKDQGALEKIFGNSNKLNRIHIEPFDASRHAKARKDGKVNYPAPFSYPLSQQGQIKSYITQKKREVGRAKSGWGSCLAALGDAVAGWLKKDGTGEVKDHSAEANPYIILSNKVPYMAALDAQKEIVSRSLAGKAKDMIKSAENALRRAARSAGLH